MSNKKIYNMASTFASSKYALNTVFFILCMTITCTVESAISLEYKVKAAYVFKMLNFVEWNNETVTEEDKNNVIDICVVGNDPINEAVHLLHSKQVKGRVIHVHQIDSNNNLLTCHIVFVTRQVENQLEKILLNINTKKHLTISDINGFAESGGMVELAIEENKVKLIINRKKVNDSNIHFSSKLLGIARLVDTVGSM